MIKISKYAFDQYQKNEGRGIVGKVWEIAPAGKVTDERRACGEFLDHTLSGATILCITDGEGRESLLAISRNWGSISEKIMIAEAGYKFFVRHREGKAPVDDMEKAVMDILGKHSVRFNYLVRTDEVVIMDA